MLTGEKIRQTKPGPSSPRAQDNVLTQESLSLCPQTRASYLQAHLVFIAGFN